MKFAQFFTRLVVTVCICAVMLFANVVPASAAQDKHTKLIEQLPLPNVQKKSEEILKTSPYETNPEYKSEDTSNQGLNEVQGTADFDKMSRSSETVPPVIKDAAKAFDKVGDKLNSAKEDTQDSVTSTLGKAGDKAGDAANFVKDKAGDAVNSITDKAVDTAKAIKNKVKS